MGECEYLLEADVKEGLTKDGIFDFEAREICKLSLDTFSWNM